MGREGGAGGLRVMLRVLKALETGSSGKVSAQEASPLPQPRPSVFAPRPAGLGEGGDRATHGPMV